MKPQSEPTGHKEGTSRRQVHSTKCLLEKNLRVLIFYLFSISENYTAKRIDTPEEYRERNSGLKSLN